MSRPPKSPAPFRRGLFVWAIGGILILLTQGLVRLSPIAFEVLAPGQLSSGQRALLISWVLLNLYLEGYKGFQLKFVPRVVARALFLARRPLVGLPARAFAPLFSMAYFQAKARARRSAWILTGVILLAVAVVRRLPQPWRGIIDAGVVAGLGFGAIALGVAALRALREGTSPGDPELDEVL